MKKLLASLFLVGSVLSFAETSGICNDSVCTTEGAIKVSVKVPKPFKLCLYDIDFDFWCGTKNIDKSAALMVSGDKAPFSITLGDNGNFELTHETEPSKKINAKIVFENEGSHKLTNTGTGHTTTQVKATLLAAPGLTHGNYKGEAKVVVTYDLI